MKYPQDGDVVVVSVTSTSTLDAELHRRMRELVQTGASRILLDLTGLKDIDSKGVGELVLAHISMAQAGGSIALIHVHHRVKELLRRVGLVDVLAIFEDGVSDPAFDRSEVYIG